MRFVLSALALLAGVAVAGDQSLPYPIWDQNDFVGQYERAMTLSRLTTYPGGVHGLYAHE